MRHAKSAIAIMLMASLFVPTVDAKSKAPVKPTPPATSQAGGLPATNARVAALEGAVATLQANVAALSAQLAITPTVFVADGFRNGLTGGPVVVATKTVPAGSYLIMAAVQMVNSQALADAKARCTMSADGNVLLADTSDLLFPILTTAAGPPSGAFGSTIFAPLQSSYSSRSPITIVVACSEGNGGGAGLDAFVNLAALKVATIQ